MPHTHSVILGVCRSTKLRADMTPSVERACKKEALRKAMNDSKQKGKNKPRI